MNSVTTPTITEKLDGEIQLKVVTQKQLAAALGLGTTRINQLIDEGIVVRDETARNGQVMLFESLRNFFLSRNANWGDGSEPVNFWRERGLHEKAKREIAEVKLAKMKGELYESATVESVLGEIITNFRNKLLGLPSKYAAQLDGKNRGEIYSILTEAIEENLTELAAQLEDASFDDSDVGDENIADS